MQNCPYKSVKLKGSIRGRAFESLKLGIAVAVGVVGALILGTGMSLFMTDLGASLGALAFVLGIVIGVVGLSSSSSSQSKDDMTVHRHLGWSGG